MIKNILLGIRLFVDKPISNLILSMQLSIVAIIILILGNINAFSDACLNTLQSADCRIILCQDVDRQKDIVETLEKLKAKYQSIKGFSKFSEGVISFNVEQLENKRGLEGEQSAMVNLFDDTTISEIQFPLSEGEWFTAELIDGKIPCVIGGKYSENYKVGQVIKGYSDMNQYTGSEDLEIVEREFIITGILKEPGIMFKTGFTMTDAFARNLFMEFQHSYTMNIFASERLSDIGHSEQDRHNSIRTTLLYVDKNTSDQEIEAIRNDFMHKNTNMIEELIERENGDLKQTFDLMFPFILMLFLIVLCGIVAVSILTAIRQLKTFKIYYLVGCPRGRTTGIMGIYSFCYFVVSSISFYFCMKFVVYFNTHVMSEQDYYVIIDSDNLLFIALGCMVVLVLSFAIPFFIVKRQNIIDLLRKD